MIASQEREFRPHSYRYDPQPRGRTTPSSSWESATTMKMSVESMEMAPGAIPRPGRVPEQRLLSPKIRWRWWRHSGDFRGRRQKDLGFSRRRKLIGGRAMPGGGQGAHTLPGRGQGWTRAQGWCGHPGAPLRLQFGLRGRVGKNRNFGFRIVQFREYFLCNFSDTQKQQKTGNWHCGNLLIG